MEEQEIIARFKQMRGEQQAIANKIAELEAEYNEHSLVVSAIDKLESTRRCYRLVGGVLVERTVGEVLPAVTKNRDGLLDITKQLREQLQKKSTELNEFATKYKIQVKGSPSEEEDDREEEQAKPSTGVLV